MGVDDKDGNNADSIVAKAFKYFLVCLSLAISAAAVSVIFEIGEIHKILQEICAPEIPIYKLFVRFSYLFLLGNLLYLAWHFAIKKRRAFPLNEAPYFIWLCVGNFLMLVLFYAQFFQPTYGGYSNANRCIILFKDK